MVFIALAAAPTFSARAGPTKIIVKRIAVSFSLSGVVEARPPILRGENLQICNKNH
jgi:hypothetical protein